MVLENGMVKRRLSVPVENDWDSLIHNPRGIVCRNHSKTVIVYQTNRGLDMRRAKLFRQVSRKGDGSTQP